MGTRDLKESKQAHYFAPATPVEGADEGTRAISPLSPFVVSGGKNTERYYFTHISAVSDKYRFNIRPKYFGDESAYTEVFPKRIAEILSKNADAKIFCVFDMDTVVKDGLQDKHKAFVDALDHEIKSGQVVLCESMPSFEFWLLLHFTDYSGLLRNYEEVSDLLAPYIKQYFPDSGKRLKKLLKSERYVQDPTWVKRLLDESRLDLAIERAKLCLTREITEKGKHSYTKVYKSFEIKADSRSEINAKGWDAVMQLGRQAEKAGIQDMSLDEINAIIKEVRDAR